MFEIILIALLLSSPICIFFGIKAFIKSCNDNTNQGIPQTDEQRLNNLNKRIFASYFGLTSKGETGENCAELQLLKLTIPKKIIRNAYIPNKNTTAEIDLILITEYGIYVIECKNYSGWIFGSQNGRNWTQTLNKKSKYKFYNPILQNNTHIKALSSYLNINIEKFHSIIVFGRNAEFKKIPPNTNEYYIIHDYQINNVMQYEIQNRSKVISEEYIDKIYNMLLPTTQVSQETKQQHIENAQKHK